MSIVLRPQLPLADAPLMTLAAAVATVRSLTEQHITATIKWPNDVLHEDGKLAGILTEIAGETDQIAWAVIGIGINANIEEARLPAEATSLMAIRGEPVNRRQLIQRLLTELHDLIHAPETILPAWRAHADTLGRTVRVETAQGTIEGEAVDVTQSGSLIIDTGTERTQVHAGDCEHLRPQNA